VKATHPMDLPTQRIRDLPAPDEPSSFRIEDVVGADRLHELEWLQTIVWGNDKSDVVPAHIFYVAVASGGVVLAAYDGAKPIGFVLGFLGQRDGKLYHASHMLGIDPAYQSHGVGAALKWEQRDRALSQGLDVMTWTFDPLEMRNAHFNLHKLGAMSRIYRTDIYGDLNDQLNRGLPTDRLEVEWFLNRVPRAPRPLPAGAVAILSSAGDKPVLDYGAAEGAPALTIDAPANIQRLKRELPALALKWRLDQRSAFAWAFARGYYVTGFLSGAFVLERTQEFDDAD